MSEFSREFAQILGMLLYCHKRNVWKVHLDIIFLDEIAEAAKSIQYMYKRNLCRQPGVKS